MQSVEKLVTRSDAWTADDDEKLASLVLMHIRTGSTQLRAFEEAAGELGRTAAACGYRWNGVVRRNYREEIETAKQERKNAQRAPAPTAAALPSPISASVAEEPRTMTSSDTMKDVIQFLTAFDDQYQRLRQQIDALETERQNLTERVRELETQLAKTPAGSASPVTPQQLEEDSKTLFAIMERARKLLEGDGPASSNG